MWHHIVCMCVCVCVLYLVQGGRSVDRPPCTRYNIELRYDVFSMMLDILGFPRVSL